MEETEIGEVGVDKLNERAHEKAREGKHQFLESGLRYLTRLPVVLLGTHLHQGCLIYCQIVSHAHPIALLPHPDAKHELPNTSALHTSVPTQLIPAPPHHPNVQLAQARRRADPP